MTIKLTDEANSAFIYKLNDNGCNKWWCQVQAGRTNDKTRTSDEELHQVALKMAASEAMYDALLAVGKELFFDSVSATAGSPELWEQVLAAIALATKGE